MNKSETPTQKNSLEKDWSKIVESAKYAMENFQNFHSDNVVVWADDRINQLSATTDALRLEAGMLKRELEEARRQIEEMKCCENCSSKYSGCHDCDKSVYSCRNCRCKGCEKYSRWEKQ